MTSTGPSDSDDRPRRYEVFFDARATRDLDGIPDRDFERIDARIQSLRENPRPHGVETLASHTYRIRVGDWRVFYLVDDPNLRVVITAVRRRNERTYKRF